MMKRRLLKLGVFLLLGAVINVAVAWGCSAFTSNVIIRAIEGRSSAEPDPATTSWAGSEVNFVIITSRGPGIENQLWFSGPERLDEQADMNQLFHVLDEMFGFVERPGRLSLPASNQRYKPRCELRTRAGWPILGLTCSCNTAAEATESGDDAIVFKPVIGRRIRLRYLPLSPIWPGFAVNTLFYAAVFWLLFAAPFAMRRRLRLRRGQCPHCAYPIGTWGGEICTECGRPLPARPRLRDPNETTEDTESHRGSQRAEHK
jgi:hypothetical protein